MDEVSDRARPEGTEKGDFQSVEKNLINHDWIISLERVQTTHTHNISRV